MPIVVAVADAIAIAARSCPCAFSDILSPRLPVRILSLHLSVLVCLNSGGWTTGWSGKEMRTPIDVAAVAIVAEAIAIAVAILVQE